MNIRGFMEEFLKDDRSVAKKVFKKSIKQIKFN